MALAAKSMPLKPMLEPEEATICQLWGGVPSGQQVVVNWPVGVIWLTSPTSVEPGITGGLAVWGSTLVHKGSARSAREKPPVVVFSSML